MKTLKTENGKKTVLKSFETFEELWVSAYISKKKIFLGTKTELLQKDEEFWKPLVESVFDNLGGIYKNYETMKIASTAKESGHSILEGEGEFILITEEKI